MNRLVDTVDNKEVALKILEDLVKRIANDEINVAGLTIERGFDKNTDHKKNLDKYKFNGQIDIRLALLDNKITKSDPAP